MQNLRLEFPSQTHRGWLKESSWGGMKGMVLMVLVNIVEPLTYTCPERMQLPAIFRPTGSTSWSVIMQLAELWSEAWEFWWDDFCCFILKSLVVFLTSLCLFVSLDWHSVCVTAVEEFFSVQTSSFSPCCAVLSVVCCCLALCLLWVYLWMVCEVGTVRPEIRGESLLLLWSADGKQPRQVQRA